MKLNKIFGLCAIACATLSGQAMAAMTSAENVIVNDANNNGRVIYIAGSPALKSSFTAIESYMFSGTRIRFDDGNSKYIAAAGKLAMPAGTWSAGTAVIVIYGTVGGSENGVNPVARNEKITTLTVTSAACGATGTGTAGDPYICTVDNPGLGGYGRSPDAGVSDVAPALFHSAYNTGGEVAQPSLTDAELSLLTAQEIYGMAYGVAVTKNLGLFNLNKAVVSAIMTGNVGTWDAVDASQSGDILVCRLTPGSGTQAVTNMYFGNYPCDTSSALNAPADRDASGAWNATTHTFTVTPNTGGLVVVENATSDGVRTCLDIAVKGGAYTTSDRNGYPVTVNMGAGGHKAIGVLSMDSLSSSKAAGNWQFRSLDGAGTITWDNTAAAPVVSGTGRFPTLASYVDGTWDMHGLVFLNVPARSQGNKSQFLARFLNKARDPTLLASISNLKNAAAAIPGISYPQYSGPQVLRSVYLNTNQCAPYNRNY